MIIAFDRPNIQPFPPSLIPAFNVLVLHREARDVHHHDRTAVVRILRRRQLGFDQGLSLHHPDLQHIDLARTLCPIPLLLRHQVCSN